MVAAISICPRAQPAFIGKFLVGVTAEVGLEKGFQGEAGGFPDQLQEEVLQCRVKWFLWKSICFICSVYTWDAQSLLVWSSCVIYVVKSSELTSLILQKSFVHIVVYLFGHLDSMILWLCNLSWAKESSPSSSSFEYKSHIPLLFAQR